MKKDWRNWIHLAWCLQICQEIAWKGKETTRLLALNFDGSSITDTTRRTMFTVKEEGFSLNVKKKAWMLERLIKGCNKLLRKVWNPGCRELQNFNQKTRMGETTDDTKLALELRSKTCPRLFFHQFSMIFGNICLLLNAYLSHHLSQSHCSSFDTT